MINDTMITHSPETGYPVTAVSRRRRVRPPNRPTQAPAQMLLRGAWYLLAAILTALAALWLALGAASQVAAYQAQTSTQPTTSTVAPTWDQEQAAPAVGESWATISIPAIDLHDVVVLEGTEAAQIDVGVGHYTGTEFPWDGTGNVGLAGHRTGWGEPFHDLDQLKPGDEIVVSTADAVYTYRVTGSTVVDPSQVWVLEDLSPEVTGATDAESQVLTLTTCEGSQNEQRLVVWAELTDVTATAGEAPSSAGA